MTFAASEGVLRTLRKIVFALLLSLPLVVIAQTEKADKSNKPYRILTSGKQVTVRSAKDIKSLMVWTASGHRIVEQKELNVPSYDFRIEVKDKYFFLMIQLVDGKVYTEKIGVP